MREFGCADAANADAANHWPSAWSIP